MSNETIHQAVESLREGKIIAYPTDTLFGLGVDALNEEAIGDLYRLKQRSKHRPMSIMVPVGQWRGWVRSVNSKAGKLADKYYPGPITLIMNAGDKIPKLLTKYTNGTIGVRVPNHPVCLEMLNEFDSPIITTSANLSNQPAAKGPVQIEEYFGEGVAHIITDGPSPGGIASTVIDVTESEPVVLREGAISEFAVWRTLQ
ncbi:MAG: Threonylcarbamoyl-AMP synthase [Candidatus Marinimicrobia bacterium]|nr:Threonylcarbamoyl-AMP synthase [Candidatus Neomarinimicrobiota bacterium]